MLDYFVSTRAAGRHARATILSTVHELCSTSLWHLFRGSPGGLAQDDVRKHVQGMAHGAAHLHSMGIVHGDLSLRNVLVDVDGGVKVTDFGTAFSAHVYLVQEEFTTGYVQAPEATLGETRQTTAIDAWAVGVAAFCLRFGHCPWLPYESTDDALEVQARMLGSISTQSWPGHNLLPRWPTWRDKHGAVNDYLRNSAPLTFWGRVEPMLPAYRGPEPQTAEVAFICGLLRWNPLDRQSCAAAAYSQYLVGDQAVVAVPGAALGDEGASSMAQGQATGDSKAPGQAHDDGIESVDRLARCWCSGNCGRRLCKRWQTVLVRGQEKEGEDKGCLGRPVLGGRCCARCTCEVQTCVRPRNGREGKKRWCKTHGGKLGTLEPAHHVNAYNAADVAEASAEQRSALLRPIPPKWGLPLQIVGRIAFILPSLIPDDLQALLQIGLPCGLGDKIPPVWMCMFFLAQTIKWPAAVRHFYKDLQDQHDGLVPQEIRPGAASSSASSCQRHGVATQAPRLGAASSAVPAEAMIQAYLNTLRWASGRDWGQLFQRMNGGLQDAQTGLAVNGCRLGLLKQGSSVPSSLSPPRRRKSQKIVDTPAATPQYTALKLGPGDSVYLLVEVGSDDHVEAVAIVQYMIESAAAANLDWPARPCDVAKFAEGFLQWTRAVRRFSPGQHGFDGGKSPSHQYKAKSLTRAALILLDSCLDDAVGQFTMGELQQWLPDEMAHCAPLEKLSVTEVQRRVGVHALFVSCWTCLCGWMGPDDGRRLLRATDSELWEVVDAEDVKQQDDVILRGIESNAFMPGPHVLAMLLPERS